MVKLRTEDTFEEPAREKIQMNVMNPHTLLYHLNIYIIPKGNQYRTEQKLRRMK